MGALDGKKVVLVVTGGIAAYKAAELTSRLAKAGAATRVVMTDSARKFIAPLTFESLCGHPVYEDVFARPTAWEMEHIGWARWAEMAVIAPATANTIAKLAHGLADDAASTLLLAYEGPVWLAPSMNTAMYQHPATQQNLNTLAARGVTLINPGSGRLACGEVGPGRMAEPNEIIAVLSGTPETGAPTAPTDQSLDGRHVLITAGPTREALDPIRFISNRSTGRMAAALAETALARGARVTVVHGPLETPLPRGMAAVPAESARQMLAAVQAHWEQTDIAIFAAAVANYEAADSVPGKLKGGERLTLELRRTPDIAAWGGENRRPGQVLVGFSAESENALATARHKLEAKGMDLICANPIGEQGVGFGAVNNRVTIVGAQGDPAELPVAGKPEIAAAIWDRIAARLA